MAQETIHLLTGNPDKLRLARLVFDRYDIAVVSADFKEPEIQADTSQEVARYAARTAFRQLGVPVLREDHSFYIDDLGIPGPYMAYVDKRIPVERLVKIVDTLESRRAHFTIAATYVGGEDDEYESSFDVPVTIAHEAKGNPNLNWERAMMLEGQTSTFAERSSEERDHLWTHNYEEIAHHITTRR